MVTFLLLHAYLSRLIIRLTERSILLAILWINLPVNLPQGIVFSKETIGTGWISAGSVYLYSNVLMLSYYFDAEDIVVPHSFQLYYTF